MCLVAFLAVFQIDVGDIGALTKVRIEHDNSHSFPSWHVKLVSWLDIWMEKVHLHALIEALVLSNLENHLCDQM